MAKVLVGYKLLSRSSRFTRGVPFNRYEGIDFIEGIYKDHRRIKREKRRASSTSTAEHGK